MNAEIGQLDAIKKRLDQLLPESIEDYGLKEEMLIFVEQDIQRRECVKNQRGEFVKNLKAFRTAHLKSLLICSLICLSSVRSASSGGYGWIIVPLLALSGLWIYRSVKIQKGFVNLVQSAQTSEEQPFVSDEVMKKLERYKLAKEYHKLPDETKGFLAKKLANEIVS
jgi:hypothetical protein